MTFSMRTLKSMNIAQYWIKNSKITLLIKRVLLMNILLWQMIMIIAVYVYGNRVSLVGLWQTTQFYWGNNSPDMHINLIRKNGHRKGGGPFPPIFPAGHHGLLSEILITWQVRIFVCQLVPSPSIWKLWKNWNDKRERKIYGIINILFFVLSKV